MKAINPIGQLERLYGDEFDYSKSVYTGYDKRIVIIDRDTGLEFEQSYQSHKKRYS